MEESEMIESALSVLGMISIIALVCLFTIAYDVESTGNSAMTDRIIKRLTRIDSDGQRSALMNTYVNPQMAISEGATDVHGITNADVADAPTFAQIGNQLKSHFEGAEAVIGYNSTKFDNIMLVSRVFTQQHQFQRIRQTSN